MALKGYVTFMYAWYQLSHLQPIHAKTAVESMHISKCSVFWADQLKYPDFISVLKRASPSFLFSLIGTETDRNN